MKKTILHIASIAVIVSSASAATITYNDSTGSYGAYTDGPFAATFGALTNQDPNPISETTSVYDYRGLTATVSSGATYFFLEDFQDGQLDTPGLSTGSFNSNFTPRTNDGRNGSQSKTTSNVAEDTTAGQGAFRIGSTSTNTWTFNAGALGGNLPTYFGFAFPEDFNGANDYADLVTAYDIDNNVIGTIDNTAGVTPSAVPFYGFQTDVGISHVEITMNAAGEMDHFQYGFVAIPEPGAALLGGVGCLLLLRRRRC